MFAFVLAFIFFYFTPILGYFQKFIKVLNTFFFIFVDYYV